MKKIFQHFLYSYILLMTQIVFAAEPLPGTNSQWMEDNALDPDSIASIKYAIQLCKEKKIDQIQDAEPDASQAGGLRVGSMVIPCSKLLEKEPELNKLVTNAEAIASGASDPNEESNNNDFTHCVFLDGEYQPMTENQFREFQNLQGHVAELGSEAVTEPNADGSPNKICPAGAPFSCSLFEGLDGGCARKFLKGIWDNITSNAEMIAAIGKAIGGAVVDAVSGAYRWVKGVFTSMNQVENVSANKAHLASHATKKEVAKEQQVRKEDPAHKNESIMGFVKRKIEELMNYIWESSVEHYACLQQDPETNKCSAVPKSWECTPCNHRKNIFCGMGGFIAGEVLSTLLTGGAIRAAGLVLKAVKGSRLAKPFVAIGSKTGTVLSKTGKAIAKTRAYRIARVVTKKGLKKTNKFLEATKGKMAAKVGGKLGSIAGVKIIGRTAYFLIVAPLKKYFKALNMAFDVGLKGWTKARAGWSAAKAAKAGEVAKAGEAATEVAQESTGLVVRENSALTKSEAASNVKASEKPAINNSKNSGSTSPSSSKGNEIPKQPGEVSNPKSSSTTTNVNDGKSVSMVEEKNGNTISQTVSPVKKELNTTGGASGESFGGGGSAPASARGGPSGGGSAPLNNQSVVAPSNYNSSISKTHFENSNFSRPTQNGGATKVNEPLIGLNKDSELIQKYKAKNEYKDYFNDLIDPKDHGKLARKIEEIENKYGHNPDELFKQIHDFRNSLVNEVSKYKNDINYRKYFDIVTDAKDQELLAYKIRELENSLGLNNSNKIITGVEDYLKQDKFLPYKMEYTSKLKAKLKNQFESGDSYKILDVDPSMLTKEDLLAKKAKAINTLEEIPDMNLRNKWIKNVESSFDKINQEQQFISKFKDSNIYKDIFDKVPYDKEGKLAKTIEFLEGKHRGNTNALMKELKDWSKRDQIVDEKIYNRISHTRDYKPYRDAIKGGKEKRMFAKHVDELETKLLGNRGKVLEELKKEQALRARDAEKINPRVEFDQNYFNSIKNRPEYSEHFILVNNVNDQRKLASQIVELEKQFPKNPNMVNANLDKFMSKELGVVRLEPKSTKVMGASKKSGYSIFDDSIKLPVEEINRLKNSHEFEKYFQSMARTPDEANDLAKIIRDLEIKHNGDAKLIQRDLTTIENKFMKEGCKIP